MRHNVVIFTDYFMEGVISLVEGASLSLGLHAAGTYQDFIDLVMTTPNLLGCLIIEHAPRKKSIKFYKDIVRILDTVAHSQERVVTLSIMYRSKVVPKLVYQTKSSGITIAMHKYSRITEENIRLDGLVPIVITTQGVFKTNTIKDFELSPDSLSLRQRDTLIDAFVYMLSDNPSDDILAKHFRRHPELRRVWSLTTSDDEWQKCQEMFKDSAFLIFCEMLREKRFNVATAS